MNIKNLIHFYKKLFFNQFLAEKIVKTGDIVRVHYIGIKKDIIRFDGIVTSVYGKSFLEAITAVKKFGPFGIAMKFFLNSEFIINIKIITKLKKRKAKLYYIRSTKKKDLHLKAFEPSEICI